jgi:hypothetical protein
MNVAEGRLVALPPSSISTGRDQHESLYHIRRATAGRRALSGEGESRSRIAVQFCRHCGRETESATDVLKVGATSYDVIYCSECGIASSAFRLSREGKREGPADNMMLRRLHKPAKK